MKISTNAPIADVQSLNAVHTLLSNRCRRYTIEALSDREPPIALVDLADAVATRKSKTEADGGSEKTADEIASLLHHTHLPKFDDANVLEYDIERNVVTSIDREILAALENA